MPPLIRLLRPHQWVKNLFVLAPLFFTPMAVSQANIIGVILGMLAFCFTASAIYIFNDYQDRAADRQHPRKKKRPLASGAVSIPAAFLVMAILIAGAIALCLMLPPSFRMVLGLYAGLNLLYNVGLKNIAILDVCIIAFGFVLRVAAGAEAVSIEASAWILIITGLLALFIALAKRRDDVIQMLDATHRKSLSGYNKPFLDISVAVVLGAMLVSYLIYTTDPLVMERLGNRNLYATAPFVVLGILRYLQVIFVEERSGQPTQLVLTDRFLILTILGWVLTFGYLIY